MGFFCPLDVFPKCSFSNSCSFSSVWAALLKLYLVCSVSVFNLLGSIAEWRKAAGWSDDLSPHASVASNRWSALTNGWVCAQTRQQRDRKFGELFHAVNSLLSLWFCNFASFSHQLTHLSAASGVDRMCVTRDQDGVSAMRTILIASMNTYCEFITCSLLDAQMPWTKSILVWCSCPKLST